MDSGMALVVLALLGAVHGLNPAMGWLFAVSLGLQEQRRGAVWAALGPLALGHALAIAAALLLAAVVGLVIPVSTLKWIAAAALLGFGVFQLMRHKHPRYGGMRVNAKHLTIWSFLMASAHGAGLMALPFVLGAAAASATAGGDAGHAGHLGHAGHGAHAVAPPASSVDALGASVMMQLDVTGLLAVLVHTAGYLAVAGLLALIVYEKLGLRLLRTAWINLNVIWAGALILTALLTPLL
jgi:hypothetical protein